MLDHRFPTALQIMQTMVYLEGLSVERVSSAQLAEGLGANHTLVRRIVASLVQRGLLASQMGRTGGVCLARTPDTIGLHEIYEAVLSGKPVWTARANTPSGCPVSRNFDAYLHDLSVQADGALQAFLKARTLAMSYAEILALDRRMCRGDMALTIHSR